MSKNLYFSNFIQFIQKTEIQIPTGTVSLNLDIKGWKLVPRGSPYNYPQITRKPPISEVRCSFGSSRAVSIFDKVG